MQRTAARMNFWQAQVLVYLESGRRNGISLEGFRTFAAGRRVDRLRLNPSYATDATDVR